MMMHLLVPLGSLRQLLPILWLVLVLQQRPHRQQQPSLLSTFPTQTRLFFVQLNRLRGAQPHDSPTATRWGH
jgi:hypothetical protein